MSILNIRALSRRLKKDFHFFLLKGEKAGKEERETLCATVAETTGSESSWLKSSFKLHSDLIVRDRTMHLL